MVFAKVFLPNKTPSLDSIDSFLEIYERHKVGALVSCGGGFPSYARPNAEWWVGGVFLVFKSARALGQGGEAAGSVGAAVAAAGGGRGPLFESCNAQQGSSLLLSLTSLFRIILNPSCCQSEVHSSHAEPRRNRIGTASPKRRRQHDPISKVRLTLIMPWIMRSISRNSYYRVLGPRSLFSILIITRNS